MSQKDLGWRTALNVRFNNVDISEDINDNLISLKYTDESEGAADDLSIVIHDRDTKWVKNWLKKEMEQRDRANADIARGIYESSATDTAPQTTANYTVTAKIGLNVRKGRGTGYGKLGALSYGATVEVYGIVDNWAEIRYSGQTAYCCAAYLKLAHAEKNQTKHIESYDGRKTPNAKYTKISAVITAQNVDENGTDRVLDCGKFELDSVKFTAPPAKVEMDATSLSYESTVRKVKKTRSWSHTNLKEIAADIAAAGGYNLMYSSAFNPTYSYILQSDISDIEFLSQRCNAAGLKLKVTDGILVIFDSKEYDSKGAVRIFRMGDGTYESISLESTLATAAYSSCHVSYEDDQGNTYEATFTPPTAYSEGEVLEVKEQVGSDQEAMELAKRRLRAANKGEITGKIKMQGDPGMVAGVNIQLIGFGDFDGKYSVDKSTHKIPPYTTDIEISKVIEGY